MLEALYSPLAQNYEIPKKPLFSMDSDMWLSQSMDNTVYVAESHVENIFSVMNGGLSIRCKTETETVEVENEVTVMGAYHCKQKGNSTVNVGGVACSVSLDLLVDGASCTLSHSPSQRLSLKDGSFHRRCKGAVNSDGNLMFDYDYRHVASTSHSSAWAAEMVYSNFRGVYSTGSPASSFTERQAVFRSSKNSLRYPEVFHIECVVSVIVDEDEWTLIQKSQLNHIQQRSLSTSCAVSSSLHVECTVNGGQKSGRISDPTVYFLSGEHRPRKSYRVDDFHGSEPEYNDLCNSDMFSNNVEEDSRVFIVRAAFGFDYDETKPFTSVVVNLTGSHALGANPVPRSLSFEKTRKQAQQDLDDFLFQSEVTLELEDEPKERTKTSLRYNTLRLFFISRNITKGLPYRACGTDEGLVFDLSQYIFHGTYFAFSQPTVSLNLLMTLYHMIDAARKNARCQGLEYGAIFPLRTIEGSECMPNAGSEAYVHINGEIGLLIFHSFIINLNIPDGAQLPLLELMLETARIWPRLGNWVEERNAFIIKASFGHDLYNKSSADTIFVSMVAKMHLDLTVQLIASQEKILGTPVIDGLLKKIHMSRSELQSFTSVGNRIVLEKSSRFPEVFSVHQSFDTLHAWPEERVTHPLALNYHPLTIYQRHVVDVPDVLLGMLMNSHFPFPTSVYKANVEHYLPLCAFDSPECLSVAAVMHCRAYRNLGKPMHCYRVLSHLNMDNITYCSEEGLDHLAMSSSLLIPLLGLSGITISSGSLTMDPIITAGVASYSVYFNWSGCRLRLSVTPEDILYELVRGDSLRFLHGVDRHRIHLHTGFRSVKAAASLRIPRVTIRQEGVFEGVIVLLDAVVHNILEYHYVSWHHIFERLFNTYRTLHNMNVKPLNPEEFIELMVYSKEESAPFTGIRDILAKRNILLDLGTPDDAEIVDTHYGLSNANTAEITELFQQQKPTLNPELLRLLQNLAESHVPMALVTYSKHLKLLLGIFPELSKLFITCIDGDEVFDANLKGQPHVDIYRRAAQKIHSSPRRCIVISHHLDRGYDVHDLAEFFMFFDVDDPFVNRVPQFEYPVLSPEQVAEEGRENPLIVKLHLNSIPKSIEEFETAAQGE